MSSERSEAMVSRPHPIQPWSRFRNIRPNQPATRVLRALGGGLFFLMFALFASPAFSLDATLAWDPNTEPDLEGYGVYFSKDTPGPPYNLFGYVTTAELDDSANPTFTVTGLVKGARYFLSLTAYDTSGAESSFSAAVCADVGDTIAPCPSASTGDGGGGSGGGGCFIGTSLGGSGHFDPRFDRWIAGLSALASLAAFLGIARRRFKRSYLPARSQARKSRRALLLK